MGLSDVSNLHAASVSGAPAPGGMYPARPVPEHPPRPEFAWQRAPFLAGCTGVEHLASTWPYLQNDDPAFETLRW